MRGRHRFDGPSRDDRTGPARASSGTRTESRPGAPVMLGLTFRHCFSDYSPVILDSVIRHLIVRRMRNARNRGLFGMRGETAEQRRKNATARCHGAHGVGRPAAEPTSGTGGWRWAPRPTRREPLHRGPATVRVRRAPREVPPSLRRRGGRYPSPTPRTGDSTTGTDRRAPFRLVWPGPPRGRAEEAVLPPRAVGCP